MSLCTLRPFKILDYVYELSNTRELECYNLLYYCVSLYYVWASVLNRSNWSTALSKPHCYPVYLLPLQKSLSLLFAINNYSWVLKRGCHIVLSSVISSVSAQHQRGQNATQFCVPCWESGLVHGSALRQARRRGTGKASAVHLAGAPRPDTRVRDTPSRSLWDV